ncbi:MAG: M23 family metallopeptidase, partial [Clostridia bacterium]|nr:M23 family metallopeptidase [Clostridia bacterium]
DARKMADEALAYMQSLQANDAALVQEYHTAKAMETELNEKLEERLRQLQEQEKSSYVGGSMGWPLPVDVNYQVSSEYGWRKLWGADDFHLGIDLACAANTAVYAANAGKVIESQYHYSYGNYVLIDHGGGKATLYAHMNERWVSAGDKVTKGQQIGLVGTTGSSSGNHLHFEVRENGKVQEPRNYINLP